MKWLKKGMGRGVHPYWQRLLRQRKGMEVAFSVGRRGSFALEGYLESEQSMRAYRTPAKYAGEMYHVTDAKRLPGIRKHGLRAQPPPVDPLIHRGAEVPSVSFAPSREQAEKSLSDMLPDRPAVLRMKKEAYARYGIYDMALVGWTQAPDYSRSPGLQETGDFTDVNELRVFQSVLPADLELLTPSGSAVSLVRVKRSKTGHKAHVRRVR